MKPIIDLVNASAVEAVRKSGMTVEVAKSAVVESVDNAAGLCSVRVDDNGDEIYENVRLIGGGVMVPDLVTILRTAGGWVCLGPQLGAWNNTGWRTPSLQSALEPYPSRYPPQYRRIGDRVELRGMIRTTAAVGGSISLFFMQGDCRPQFRRVFTQPRSGGATYLMNIDPTGEVSTSSGAQGSAAFFSIETVFYLS